MPEINIKEIQRRLLEIAEEKKAEEAKARREQLHIDLKQQYNDGRDSADFFAGLLD